jgi:DNA helicase-2/ATP-dependent DNA helicase PcrA
MTRPADPRFIPKTIHPTDEQIAIQLSQSKVTLIHANAGAAKTTTLALRIGEAIARSLAPEHMLALVFTPEARDVLKERMVEVGIARATAARVQVATFEEFAIAALEQIEQRKTPAVAQIKDLKSHVLAALQSVSDQYSGQLDYLDIDTSSVALSQFFHAQLELKATLRLQHDAATMARCCFAARSMPPMTWPACSTPIPRCAPCCRATASSCATNCMT